MHESKVMEVFFSLDRQETRELRRFVRSDLHNKHEKVVSLLDFICSRGKLTPESLSKEKAFAYLFPNEVFDGKKLLHVMSYLFKVMESFLAYAEWKDNGVTADLSLLRSYRKRRLDKRFKKSVEIAGKDLERGQLRNARYHFLKYQMGFEHYEYISEQSRDIRSNLQEVSDGLNTYFIAEKLKQACGIYAHKTVNPKEYEIDLLDAVLLTVGKNDKYLKIPAISFYYFGYHLLVHSDESFFIPFKNLLVNEGNKFPEEELRDLYLIAINFCIKQLNLGNPPFLSELFDMYKLSLESGVLLQGKIMSRLSFINIVSVALKLNEFTWAQDFVLQYKSTLEERFREDVFDYNQAKIFYRQGRYAEAMRLLSATDFGEVLIHLDGKLMLLKMYYELDEIDSLEALLDSMRVYIHRKKVIGYHKTNYLNTISLVKKLIYLKPGDSKEGEALKSAVQSKDILTEKKWIIERIEAKC